MASEAIEQELQEKLVYIKRVAKVVKGGRRFSFSALVVVGDGQGRVGASIGKAKDVPASIKKGMNHAKKALITVPLLGDTIPHEITGKYGTARVLLKPAAPGTGVIAGSAVRIVLESLGVKDILTKSMGSDNALNIVWATLDGLKRIKDPYKTAELRNKDVKQILGFDPAPKKSGQEIKEIDMNEFDEKEPDENIKEEVKQGVSDGN